MKFWDASAIIPLCLQERDSPSLKKLIRTDQSIIAWWASPIECLFALARLRREEALSIDEEGQTQVVLRDLMASWTEASRARLFENKRFAFYACIRYEPQIPCSWPLRWFGAEAIHCTENLSVWIIDCATPQAEKGSSSCRECNSYCHLWWLS